MLDLKPVKRKKKPPRESTVEAAFVKRVKELGGIAYKFTSPARRSVPDRLVLFPRRRAMFVELKAPGKAPTPEQEREHAFLRSLGFDVDVIDTPEAARLWTPAT